MLDVPLVHGKCGFSRVSGSWHAKDPRWCPNPQPAGQLSVIRRCEQPQKAPPNQRVGAIFKGE